MQCVKCSACSLTPGSWLSLNLVFRLCVCSMDTNDGQTFTCAPFYLDSLLNVVLFVRGFLP